MAGNCDFMLHISVKVRVVLGMMPVDLSSIFLMQSQFMQYTVQERLLMT